MVCVISAEDMQETSSPDEGQHNDGSALTAMAAEHRGAIKQQLHAYHKVNYAVSC